MKPYFPILILFYKAAICQILTSSFRRNNARDDLVYSNELVANGVQAKDALRCLAMCQRVADCEHFIYNEQTQRCLFYTDPLNLDTAGTPETPWKYYGRSCDIIPSPPGIMDSGLDDLCDPNQHVLIICPASLCFQDESWYQVHRDCTTTLHEFTPTTLDPSVVTEFNLPFDLQDGHVISLHVSGNNNLNSHNRLEMYDGTNMLYHGSFRFFWGSYGRFVYNSRINWAWGTEVHADNINANYGMHYTNYTFDVHITASTYEIYSNGIHMLSGPFRAPFTNVNTLKLAQIINVFKFKIGSYGCS